MPNAGRGVPFVDDWTYVKGLDGLRAVAVILVLVFHSGLGWVTGGYLGVSVFFTLSGFLITSLLVNEAGRSGQVSLRRFWGRRIRRLLPASLICLAGVALLAPSLADPVAVESTRGDVLAALVYVANWRFVYEDVSYAELFASPSPVLHMWSLAIEEQFYLLFPLLVAGVAWWLARSRFTNLKAALALVVGTGLVASVVLSVAMSGRDRVYYGTDTRAAELLVGVLLALAWVWWWRRAAERGTGAWTATVRAVSWSGLGALAAVVWLAVVSDSGSDWVYSGWLAGFAVLSALVVAGSMVPGVTNRLLSWEPLAMVGRLSYGLYVYHWPVFVWLDEVRVGASGVRLALVQVLVTVMLATASYHLVECPVREGRSSMRRRWGWSWVPMAMVFVAITTLVMPTRGTADPLLVQTDSTPQILNPGGQAPDVNGLPVEPSPPGDATDSVADPPALLPGPGPGGEPSGVEPPEPGEEPAIPAPPVRQDPVVVVLGSDPSVAAALGELAGLEVADRTDPPCPIWQGTESQPGVPVSCVGFRTQWVADVASVPDGPHAVVVTIDPTLSAELDSRLASGRRAADSIALMAELQVAIEMVAVFGRPAFVVGADDPRLAAAIDEVIDAVSERDRPNAVARLNREHLDFVGRIAHAQLTAEQHVRTPLRLLVIGDSTSLNVAAGLAVAADGWFEVISAGVLGCPLVRTAALAHRQNDQISTDYCPNHQERWPDYFHAFSPNLVLAVASVTEQQDQRYPGIDGWHTPGGDTYQQWHDDEMEAIVSLLATRGIPFLILDSPTIGTRDRRVGDDPGRQAAWNRQIERWAATWEPVRIVSYAEHLADPNTAAGRRERPDGLHPTTDTVAHIAREHLIGDLLWTYRDATLQMEASGCRVPEGTGWRLVIERCRLR